MPPKYLKSLSNKRLQFICKFMQIIAFLCKNYKYMQLNFLGFGMKKGVQTDALRTNLAQVFQVYAKWKLAAVRQIKPIP